MENEITNMSNKTHPDGEAPIKQENYKKKEPKEEPKKEPKEEPKEEPKKKPKEEPKKKPKEEPKKEPKEESKEESKKEPKKEPKEESKKEPKKESKKEPKKEPKKESKEEPKKESKEESKEEPKEEPKKEPKKEPKILITGETFGAHEALMEQVEKKLKKKIFKKQKHPLIVFCPITSRVGSDVEAAMGKAKSDKGIILVLMHHTRDPDYPTLGTNWSETINNVDLDVHVLFHESVPGLLECSQNDKAVDQTVKFLKQQKKSKQDQPKEEKKRGK